MDGTQAFELKSRLICFISIVPLSAWEISVKNIDNLVIAKFKYLTFDPTLGVKKVSLSCLSKGTWQIMTYREKLSDISFWEMWSSLHKKANHSFCISKNPSQKGPKLSQNFVDDLQIRTWPVFNDPLPFCKLLTKFMYPFKYYWLETNI